MTLLQINISCGFNKLPYISSFELITAPAATDFIVLDGAKESDKRDVERKTTEKKLKLHDRCYNY